MSTMTNTTRSRAAVLCLGGWGLQTMLHVVPRLRSIQEQRQARGVDGPDLTRISRFATLLADPFLDPAGQAHMRLFRVRPGEPLPPFYLEHMLARLATARPEANATPAWPPEADRTVWLTDAEQRAAAILEAAAPVIEPLSLAGQPRMSPLRNGSSSAHGPDGEDRPGQVKARRRDAFRAGLVHGEEIARLLEMYVVDPIRQDSLIPGDPFVQTTLYVIAPLYEPLTSALIWPTVAHLMSHLGRRYVSQVVGIFATGSYATNRTRVLEDAGAYAGLAELEVLGGLRRNGGGRAELVALMSADSPFRSDAAASHNGYGSALGYQVGEALFDRIYLVDREKSNQGLARDSYELTVIVGNAVEAMIAADGSQHVQDQLGIDLRDPRERPYSLVGAATDYVPLEPIFQAVNQQEEKRLVRELVLAAVPDAPADGPPFVGAMQEAPAVAVESGLASLEDLGATRSQVLAQLVLQLPELFANVTPSDIAELQVSREFVLPLAVAAQLRDREPGQWQAAFAAHLAEVEARFDGVVGPDTLDGAWGLDALDASGLPRRTRDDRLLPAVATRLREQLLDTVMARPDGLSAALEQVRHWADEIDKQRQAVQALASHGSLQLAQAQRHFELRTWQKSYQQAAAAHPSLGGALLRPTLLVTLIALIAAAYGLAFGHTWDWVEDGAPLLGILVGAYTAAWMSYGRRLSQLRRLRQQRVRLAQEMLAAQLQERVRRGLVRVYDHLLQIAHQMVETLNQAVDELQQWSVAEGVPSLPPVHVATSHLYRPHLNAALWERCRTYLRSRQDPVGRRSEDRLQALWGSPPWRKEMQRLIVGESLSGPELARSVAELVQRMAAEAVAPVGVRAPNPAREQLIRDLATDYNLEHLLWRDPEQFPDRRHPLARVEGRDDPSREAENSLHRYLEFIWSNARPAANYDVAEHMATHGIPVDFAAVSGNADSDLSQMVLQDFRTTRLATGDPFRITLVRTLHGFTLDDLESVRRYRAELERLSDQVRDLITLVRDASGALYGDGRAEKPPRRRTNPQPAQKSGDGPLQARNRR